MHTAIDTRTQKDYRGTRPTFINVGHNILYRWTDLLKLLAHNTLHRRDDSRRAFTDAPSTGAEHTLSAHEWPWSAKRDGCYGVGTGPIFDVDNVLRVDECSPNLWPS